MEIEGKGLFSRQSNRRNGKVAIQQFKLHFLLCFYRNQIKPRKVRCVNMEHNTACHTKEALSKQALVICFQRKKKRKRKNIYLIKYLQVTFLLCNIVQGNSCNENANKGQKVNYKYKLEELLRTPQGFKQLPNKKKTNNADDHLKTK